MKRTSTSQIGLSGKVIHFNIVTGWCEGVPVLSSWEKTRCLFNFIIRICAFTTNPSCYSACMRAWLGKHDAQRNSNQARRLLCISRANLRWVLGKSSFFEMVHFRKSTVASKRLNINPPTHISLKRAHQGLSNAYLGLRWNCLSLKKKMFFWARRVDFWRFSRKVDLAKIRVGFFHRSFRGQKVPKIDFSKFSRRKQYLRIILPYRSSKSVLWSRRSLSFYISLPWPKKSTMAPLKHWKY